MAENSRSAFYLTFLIATLTLKFNLCEIISPLKDVTSWATDLDLRLTTALEKISGISLLQKDYTDLRKATLHTNDGGKLVKEMAANLSAYLRKKMDSLQKLVDAAEKMIINYKYDSSISVSSVKWVNMKGFSDGDPNLIYSEKFKKEINMSYSGVHVPLEIYDGYPEILNGLKWSSALDIVFKDNVKKDPTLMWQYFGSTTGFMRTYPAHAWTVKRGVLDLYDVRQRPWYIDASTSPKDMMILMDTSGSMHGQTMEIMKVSVKMLLSTLGEDDFVNIAAFSKESELISCFETFVQANRFNKRTLFQAIDKLKAYNMASLSLGLTFAFEHFDTFLRNKTSWEGANCHKIISIFTDGGTEEVKGILKKYNLEKKYRIFAFTVGPHPIPYATIKSMACDNKGYFTTVPSMSAIRTNVQDYVTVLSQPMVLIGDKEFEWTNFYVDIASLDMLTTVTLPVYNKSDIRNQSLAGIMAVDVTLQELIDKEPKLKLGPQGYSFAINRNGLVVFHPDLPIQFNSLDDPPHIDFLDIEIPNIDREIVRQAMIDRQDGERTVEGLIEMPDMKHVIHHTLKYYFAPINKTTFSLAIVLHPSRGHYLEIKDMEKSLNDLQQDDDSGILLAPWPYCHDMVLQGNSSDNLRNITISFGRNIKGLCQKSLVQHLLWDLEKTRSVLQYWQTDETDGQRDVVLSTFVSTEGGLTRVFPESTISRFLEVTDPRKALFYKRALFSKDFVFLLPEVATFDGGNETRAVVTIVKAISLMAKGGALYKPAVVGVVLDLAYIQSILLDIQPNPKRSKLSCAQSDVLLCYLLDDGGFVITTNQLDHLDTAGKFLGETDAELMDKLITEEVYLKVEKYNSESQCEKPKKVSAASKTSFILLDDIFRNFHAIFSWLFELIFCLCVWWSPANSLSELVLENDGKIPCTMFSVRYYFGENLQLQGSLLCNDKTRHLRVAPVGETNLLLVVTNHPIGCDEFQMPVQQPVEVKDPSSVCNPEVRYRRRPKKCFSHHPKENPSSCRAGAKTWKLSPFTLGMLLTLTRWFC